MNVVFEIPGCETLTLTHIKTGGYTQCWLDEASGLVYLFVNTVGDGRRIDPDRFDNSKAAISRYCDSLHLPVLNRILYNGWIERHGVYDTRFYAREVYQSIWYDPLRAKHGEAYTQYKILHRLEAEARAEYVNLKDDAKDMVDMNNLFLDAVMGHRYLPDSLQEAVRQAVTALADCGPSYRIEAEKKNFGVGPEGHLVWLDPGWDFKHYLLPRRRR